MKAMLAILLIASCACAPALAEEKDNHHSVGPPGYYKLILENESVQVLRIRIPPHEKTPMHDVTPRVILWLADAHFIDSFPNGTIREESRKAGDVEWVSKRRHAGENIGETPMEFVAVVIKSAVPAIGKPPHKTPGTH